MQKFLLATSDFGKNIREDVSTVITEGKIKNAIVHQALDLTCKNIFDIPNPLEVTFKGIKNFVTQNLVIGDLLSQVEASK